MDNNSEVGEITTNVTDEQLLSVIDNFEKSYQVGESQQAGSSDTVATEAVGFLHNISPLKKGKYFDFQLQEKDKTVRGVCFSPQKRKLFTDLSDKNSAVAIKRFRIDTNSNSQDLLMDDDVIIDAYSDVDFEKQDLPTTMNVSTTKSVCPGQIVTVTGKIAHLYPPKQVGSKNLHMLNAVLIDPSGTITLTLWEQYINKVQHGNTYTFNMSVCAKIK